MFNLRSTRRHNAYHGLPVEEFRKEAERLTKKARSVTEKEKQEIDGHLLDIDTLMPEYLEDGRASDIATANSQKYSCYRTIMVCNFILKRTSHRN